MDMEVDNLAVIESKATLEEVYQDHCVVVGVSALTFTVAVPPLTVERHTDGTLPVFTEPEVAARAVQLLNYSLPGLFTGPDRLWERDTESE